jgi:hypothetical protein
LKKSEYILREGEMWVELKNLGIRPGMSLFLSGTKVTKFKGFKANVACIVISNKCETNAR